MKKRVNFLLFTFILLFLVLFPSVIYAKEDILTCDYTIMVMDFEGETDDLVLKLNAIVYDDNSVVFKDIIAAKEYKSQKEYSKIYYNDNTDNGSVMISFPDTKDFSKNSNDNNKYKCPSLYSIYEPTVSLKISIGQAGNSVENRQFQAIVDNESVNTSNGNIASVELVKSKKYCLKSEDKLGSNVEFTFKKYNNGTEELCSSSPFSSESCFKDMSGSNSTKIKTYFFEFIDSNFNFDNPPISLQAGYSEDNGSKFYISNNSLNGYLKTYTMTTEENCYSSTPIIDSDQQAEKCEVLPEAIKKYIIDALKLIRWVALALMVVLGTLDFVKAAAADDQDALKKASQNFIKRLIAVIILFLLPILIEFILYVAGLAGFGECYPITDF